VGNLDDLRAAAVRRLESLPALSGVPVIPEDRQNILTEIQKGLGLGGGLVLTVGTGNAKGTAPNLPIPQAEVEIVVEIAEVPAINRGSAGRQIPAIHAAVLAVVALHHFAWESGKTLVFDELLYDKDDKKSIVVYTAILKTRVSFEAQLGV
jgi:hypothetical protein